MFSYNNVYVLHTSMYIIKLLKLLLIHIFYHLWPAVIAKKSVEFLSKAESHCFETVIAYV